MKFSDIPKYCINLPWRTDRREHAETEFKRFGMEVNFIDGIDGKGYGKKGNWGNILAQSSVIKKATTEYTCIFEDDVCFCDDFLQRMEYVEKSGVDFDVFYIGGWYKNKSKPIDKYLFEVNDMAGTHGYILKNTTYKFITETIGEANGMDQYLSDYVLKKFRGVIFLPVMAGTIAGFSDIQKCHVNYNNSFNVFNKEAVL